MRFIHRFFATTFLAVLFMLSLAGLSHAAPVTSKCLAVAERLSPVVPVAYRSAELAANQVRITFVGHSTFVIESPQGVRIATDYAGWHGTGEMPDVVTMNHAHETHYTDHPDPAIKHVLRGWNPEGGHAEHNLTVGDVYIRNVPTNIRSWGEAGTEKFGNSIFIFEVAGLCIGHLGHLHHELTAQQLGQIGQLDVVLIAVDGVFTLDYDGIIEVLKDLQARLVIPMHFFGSIGPLRDMLQETHDIEVSPSKTVVLSQATMPKKPKFLVLPGF
ncbi:MAG: MBL fold metallo-hydrolase [Hyphomicrobiaceae bacterium]|nr:MBL fold metallo-hydrolase [Hyphomicrobiaceae bacterium]